VLDSRLRVRALGGLRVFDPSISWTITSACTNAPTIMIAENAEDMICADRGSDLVANSTQRLTRSAPPINGIDAFFKAHD